MTMEDSEDGSQKSKGVIQTPGHMMEVFRSTATAGRPARDGWLFLPSPVVPKVRGNRSCLFPHVSFPLSTHKLCGWRMWKERVELTRIEHTAIAH